MLRFFFFFYDEFDKVQGNKQIFQIIDCEKLLTNIDLQRILFRFFFSSFLFLHFDIENNDVLLHPAIPAMLYQLPPFVKPKSWIVSSQKLKNKNSFNCFMMMHSKGTILFEQCKSVLVRVISLDFVLHLSHCSRFMFLMG